MRRDRQNDFPLDQGLPDQPEFVLFQVTQAAVNVLSGAGGCPLREIVLFAEDDRQASSSRISGESGAVDAAADDKEVSGLAYHFRHHLIRNPERATGVSRDSGAVRPESSGAPLPQPLQPQCGRCGSKPRLYAASGLHSEG